MGKSRLLKRAAQQQPGVYYLADARDAALQRRALAEAIAELIPGFSAVTYHDWKTLLERFRLEAPKGTVLILDEFPWLVRSSAELPSVLQNYVDAGGEHGHIAICGSSQSMMQGFVLDGNAPLYGRAREILKIDPLEPRWLPEALTTQTPAEAVEHYSVWGGIPRYWELAYDFEELWDAIEDLVLSPHGVLHREPERILQDELEDTARAGSLLALIGLGAHRMSEIASRLEIPGTSLSRPLSRLVELGLVVREVPFGRSVRNTKRTYYQLADPFLRFWYRFVEPNRSRLAAGQVTTVKQRVRNQWAQYLGLAWEQLARSQVARQEIAGHRWEPAMRWWDSKNEFDIVARSSDNPGILLIGEVKLRLKRSEVPNAVRQLKQKVEASALEVKNYITRLWVLHRDSTSEWMLGPGDVLNC